MSWEVRACGPQDGERLAALHDACFPADANDGTGWRLEPLISFLSQTGGLVLVADAPLGAAGFLIGRWLLDEAEILSLGVAPPWRRQGVGKALIGDYLKRLRGSGVVRCHLEVAADNSSAIGLYEAMGFDRTGRRKGYYKRVGTTNIDALILCKML